MDARYLAETEVDNRRLGELLLPALASSLGDCSLAKPVADGLEILNLACGACREMGVVASALKQVAGGKHMKVRFVGADIRGSQIDEALSRARSLASPDFHSEFVLHDCTKLPLHTEPGRGFDMVFVRHQNYWNDRFIWNRIFSAGLERLQPRGLMVITSYFDREHELALKAIAQTGGELLTSVGNPHSRGLTTPGKSVDRHLAVFRRAV